MCGADDDVEQTSNMLIEYYEGKANETPSLIPLDGQRCVIVLRLV